MNETSQKKLAFDWRYSLIILALLYFINIAGSLLAPSFNYLVPTQESGLTQTYTVVLPLHYLAFMLTTSIVMALFIYTIEKKRAYMFKAEASTNTLLIEQIAASGILILIALFALLRSGKIAIVIEYLGSFLSFVFGFIDKKTSTEDVFFLGVQGGSVMRNHTVWIIPLCIIITYAIWNVALYYTRLYATKKGYAKRVAERAELYRESEAKKGI